MTLALRLLLAFGLLTVAATALVGVGVREEWRRTEEQRFSAQLSAATAGVLSEVRWEAANLRDLLKPVCEHDAFIDQTLLDLERRELDMGRRLAITQLVPEEMKALHLDELVLFTGAGEVLGAGHDPAAAGKIDRSLVTELTSPPNYLTIRLAGQQAGPGAGKGVRGTLADGPSALVTRCLKRRGGQVVELAGARHLAPMLERIGSAYGVRLSIDDGAPYPRKPDEETASVSAPGPELDGLRLRASISRKPLEQNLASLDERILVTSGAAMAVAIALAILLARSLAGPIEALARQAREVVHGDPRPVQAKGGRELEEFARAYNRAIEDLFALRNQLARTERIAARREVARQVAHEIKNPLAPIRAAVETLRRLRARSDPAFDDYFDEATRTVLEEVYRISKIVSEFTEFARLPAPSPAAVQLEELARNVVSLYATGGAEIELEARPCPTVQVDRDQIVQVLTNLVKNGLEAAEGGSRPPRIAIRLEPAPPGHVAITVADNGPGVTPELLPRLFEPYATTKAKGTGLGLAIVRRIVEEHGGEIRYDGCGADPNTASTGTDEPRSEIANTERDRLGSGTAPAGLEGAVFRIVLPVVGPGRFERP
jgi:two-component system, NtrC family, nitrogen regulation sensor histidine kinase NtrY